MCVSECVFLVCCGFFVLHKSPQSCQFILSAPLTICALSPTVWEMTQSIALCSSTVALTAQRQASREEDGGGDGCNSTDYKHRVNVSQKSERRGQSGSCLLPAEMCTLVSLITCCTTGLLQHVLHIHPQVQTHMMMKPKWFPVSLFIGKQSKDCSLQNTVVIVHYTQ